MLVVSSLYGHASVSVDTLEQVVRLSTQLLSSGTKSGQKQTYAHCGGCTLLCNRSTLAKAHIQCSLLSPYLFIEYRDGKMPPGWKLLPVLVCRKAGNTSQPNTIAAQCGVTFSHQQRSKERSQGKEFEQLRTFERGKMRGMQIEKQRVRDRRESKRVWEIDTFQYCFK